MQCGSIQGGQGVQEVVGHDRCEKEVITTLKKSPHTLFLLLIILQGLGEGGEDCRDERNKYRLQEGCDVLLWVERSRKVNSCIGKVDCVAQEGQKAVCVCGG